MKKLKYVLFFLTIILFIVPCGTFAEEFYSGSYITYYQDSNLQTQHLSAYGVYFVNGSSYVTNTSNFRDSWFYTTHLDTTNIQGGSIYIPYTIGHSILENANVNTFHYSDYGSTCSEWTCSSSQGGACIEYSCSNTYQGTNPSDTNVVTTQYDANISLIIRCYYNGATTFVPGRVEGSNIICPVQQNATYLYGIRIFHRLITIDTETYQLGLAAGITTYNNATSKIIEQQQQTNQNLTDSSTNTSTENQSAIDNFNSNVAENNTISSLFVMPITLFQSVLNSVDGTCTPFSLGTLLGSPISFPCINPANYLGSELWGVIDVVCCGFFIFYMSKRFISIFENFSSMKDTKDEVAD